MHSEASGAAAGGGDRALARCAGPPRV